MKKSLISVVAFALAITMASCAPASKPTEQKPPAEAEKVEAEKAPEKEKEPEAKAEEKTEDKAAEAPKAEAPAVVDARTISFPEGFPVPAPVDPSAYAYDDMSKPYEFTVMAGQTFPPLDSGDVVKEYLEKQMNVKVKFLVMTGQDIAQKLPVLYASDDGPDVARIGDKVIASKLYEEGMFMDGYDAMPYMPQLTSYVTKNFIKWASSESNNKELIGIPRYSTFPDNWWYYVRSDWLKKFGMELPKTDEELLAYAKACVENDPDGNGKKDTYFGASAGNGDGLGMLSNFAAMYGQPGFYDENGKINHSMLAGTSKSHLEFLKKLNDMGALSPDWYTIDWEKFKAYSMGDKVGMVHYPGWNLVQEYYESHNKEEAAVNVWVPLKELKSADGRGGKLPAGNAPEGLFCFNTNLEKEPEKMKRIAHFLDTMIYPNENYWSSSQGGDGKVFPGTDFTRVQFNPADGTNVYFIDRDKHPGYTNPTLTGLANWQAFGYTLIWQIYDDVPMGKKGSENNMAVVGLPRYTNYEILMNFNPETQQKLKDITSRNEISFINGVRSFDEWDAYVKEWVAAGGQELIDTAAKQLGISAK